MRAIPIVSPVASQRFSSLNFLNALCFSSRMISFVVVTASKFASNNCDVRLRSRLRPCYPSTGTTFVLEFSGVLSLKES